MVSKFVLVALVAVIANTKTDASFCGCFPPPPPPPPSCLPPAFPPCNPLGDKIIVQKPGLTLPLPLPSTISLGNFCTCQKVAIKPSLLPAPAPCCPAPPPFIPGPPPFLPGPPPCAAPNGALLSSLLPLLPLLSGGLAPPACPPAFPPAFPPAPCGC